LSYKLVIADDEPLVLVGLQSMLDWSLFGVSVAGVARNGEQLMNLIETISPDIVITDIRMPVKSGLDVMRECAERFGRLPLFIILTSHEEYGYVKEAISYQAVNYLVKIELSVETLSAAINRSISMLREIKRFEPVTEDDRSGMQPFIDRFFVRLLNGLFETRDQYLQQREDLLIDIPSSGYRVGYCEIDGIDSEKMDKEKQLSLYSSTLGMVRETVTQYLLCQIISLDTRHFCVLFLSSDTTDAEVILKIREGLTHSATLVRNYFALHLQVAVGKKVEDLFDIQESFISARKLFALPGDKDRIVLFDEENRSCASEAAFDMGSYKDSLSRAFQELDFAALAEVLDRIVSSLSAAQANHALAMDAACRILYMALSLLPDGEEMISGIFESGRDGYRSIYEYKTADECLSWIGRLRNGLVGVLQNRKQDYRLRVVTKVQRYIDDNVGKKLLLSEVASIHGLSQNYLSSLFSKYGGSSFVEYTTKAKITAAKKMMAAGDLKIHEIAERLGFESAFYFSKVFKKVEGVSPREYMQQVE
jgi:two-component system, response regulator YesN